MTDQRSANLSAEFRSVLNDSLVGAGFLSPLTPLPAERDLTLGQRRTRPHEPEPFRSLVLVEDDTGVLRWSDLGAAAPSLPGRRAMTAPGPAGRILQQRKFEPLPPSRVTSFLEELDRKLNPQLAEPEAALRQFSENGLEPVRNISQARRALLVVHGTFSSSAPYFSQDPGTPWMSFLASCRDRYDRVLAFDHPTLAATPFLNAMELQRLFAEYHGDLDIICHSRGGLVVRWWLEGLRPQNLGSTRAVFVGSPLTGTSLAAPARLRGALNLLTNVARSLCVVSDLAAFAAPIFLVVSGLLRIVASFGPLSEKLPFLDAGIALAPGLASQSRIGNNLELLCLSRQAPAPASYYAVTSNFEPEDPLWAFWRPFRLARTAADCVFTGENDLVVDTEAMILDVLGREIPGDHRHEFGTNGRVHHTNYFQQPETIQFFRKVLG